MTGAERIHKAQQSLYWERAQQIANSIHADASWPESAWMLQVQIVELAELAAPASTVAPQEQAERKREFFDAGFAPASPADIRDKAEITMEQAAAAVYQRYGVNLAAFWRDAFAAEAQRHGRTEVEQYSVDGNCIHCIPICHRCRLTTIEAHLKEKDEIRSATPPSKRIEVAAKEIGAWIFKLEQPLTSETDLRVATDIVQAILKRCFSTEEEDTK